MLIGERHGCLVLAASFDESSHPLAASIRLEPNPAKRSPSTMDKELPHIAIPSFADPEQARLAPGGVLPWCQPQPGSKLASILEVGGVTDGGHERRSRQGPNAWNGAEALTYRMGLAEGGNFLVIVRELLV